MIRKSMKYSWGLGVLLLIACQSTTTTQEPFEGFGAFYERFHQDSAYQMEHIVFPLEGTDGNTSAAETFRWQKEDWALHRPVDTTNFQQTFEPVDEKMVIEYLVHESGRYSIERRFSKMQDEWKLIYYAERYGLPR